MFPDSRLFDSFSPSGMSGVLPCTSRGGMGPTRSLFAASKKVRCGSFYSDVGILPVSLFPKKLTEERLVPKVLNLPL